MSGLTLIGERSALLESLNRLRAVLAAGDAIAEATFTNNGPGADLSLVLEVDESLPELGVTAEVR